jgi:hypothetical protein
MFILLSSSASSKIKFLIRKPKIVYLFCKRKKRDSHMAADLEEQKKKVELQKKKIQLKERLLKEKERQQKFKKVSEIVELAFKAKLDEIDESILLGAFLDIREKVRDSATATTWKKNAEFHIQEQKNKPTQLLAISLKQEPSKELKDLLKKMKFRWNAFRKEFCGYGNQKELESLLKGFDFQIDSIHE